MEDHLQGDNSLGMRNSRKPRAAFGRRRKPSVAPSFCGKKVNPGFDLTRDHSEYNPMFVFECSCEGYKSEKYLRSTGECSSDEEGIGGRGIFIIIMVCLGVVFNIVYFFKTGKCSGSLFCEILECVFE